MGQERERDVIVVGAGPAGATAAIVLAQKGYDVLLLDRHNFPRDKICGDAVPAGAINIMMSLGMGEAIQQAIARGEFYPLEGMRLVSPKGKTLRAAFQEGPNGTESFVAPRVYLDAIIQQHAVESGAEFRQAVVKEPLFEDGRVAGVQAQFDDTVEEVRARMVVGADGVTSVIARALRPKEQQHIDLHRAVAIRAYIDGLEEYPGEVEFYLYNEILPGYAWIFPTGEHRANIGLGMRLDHFRNNKGNLKVLLQHFLELPEIKKRLLNGGELQAVKTWQLNFGSQRELQHAFDGALLVGDAAGFINPLTGGGIHNSMLSAKLAGQTIDEALLAGDTSRGFLRVYEEHCHEQMWGSMRRAYFMQRWLLRFPWIVDLLVGNLNQNSPLAKVFLEKL